MVCRLDNFGVRFSGAAIFRGIGFKIVAGECVGLSGNSGSGKTTLLRTLAGLSPEGGVIEGGCEVKGRVGYVPQEGLNSLSPFLSVGRQVEDLAGSRAAAESLLQRVGLSGARFYDAYPHRLSGGERQRVLIAQALALGPDLIAADEPTANLDPEIEAQILDLLASFVEETGAALLIASHRERVFSRLGCQMVYLTPPAQASARAGGEFVRERVAVRVRNLSKQYAKPGIRVLEDVSFDIYEGEFVAIVGASGAGKSTLARCLGDSLRLAGGVRLVRQEPSESLNPRTTIRRAIAEACGKRPVLLGSIGLPEGWLDRRIESLSEGQRARVALLRSAESLGEGGLLILDESLAGLDAGAREAVMQYLDVLRRERGLAVLAITHDRDWVTERGARVLRLVQGRVV